MTQVSALRLAPVKALATVLRDSITLEHDGVAEDRRMFLLRGDGSVLTQRRHPDLTAVVPSLDLANSVVSLSFPAGTTVSSALPKAGEQVQSRLFGKNRSGRLVTGDAAEALSDYVGEPVRLVLSDRAGVGWDEGPVSLLGRASAEAVAAPSSAGQPVTARFRMLVEVDGTTPYEEDSWVGRRVCLGGVRLRVTHRLERCVYINHSPSTGEPDWNGLHTLVAHRGEAGVCLGVIAEVEQPGSIAVGDQVTLVS